MIRIERLAHGVLATLEVADGKRETTYEGGRRALARALSELGAMSSTLARDERGAPVLPAGFVGSVSHKGTICVALAAVDEGARIGVDLERVARVRPGLERKILVDEELARIAPLAGEERDRHVLAHFAVKEAIYKAIDPYLRRYVGFHEAVLDFDLSRGGDVAVRLALAKGERAPVVRAMLSIVDDRVLATAKATATARARMP
jgi:4'-phosphopantetheinyl transferase EntD